MIKLRFPEYKFRFKESGDNYRIFDIIRKKFVVLTPEEWVRQHAVHFLTETLQYPETLISVEKPITASGCTMRYDIIVYNRQHKPALITECKAPGVRLTGATIEQVTRYNIFSQAGWVYITNGLEHFLYKVDFKEKKFSGVKDFPAFGEL